MPWTTIGQHLAAMRAFEAAARLRSFKAAAQELNRTPSAVSHGIRRPQSDLGQQLFVRNHRQVQLTATGRTLLEYVSRGFGELSVAYES